MTNDNLITYLNHLQGKLQKVIYIKESYPDTLETYLDSLILELSGGLKTWDVLDGDGNYIAIINVLEYFKNNLQLEHSIYKREIFKAKNTLKIITKKVEEYAKV